MSDKIKFLQGKNSDLTTTKKNGAVYFAINPDNENEYFTVKFDSSGNRYLLYADKAKKSASLEVEKSIGTINRPVYIDENGLPVALSYTIDKSVPSDAKFTDTTYSKVTTSADGLMSKEDKSKINYTNIGYGTCSTAAATAAKVVTITGNTQWTLTAGSLISVFFTYTNTAENPTLNVNSTGAKNIYFGASQITTSNLGYGGTASRVMNFMYDGTQYRFIGWGYDTNTTYTNVKLGQGYATCSTAATTVAKVASLSSYTLTVGGIVSVRFSYDVPANATLNINSKGAKAIYYRNAKITDGIIKAGDTATFIYSTYYRLIAIDRWQEDIVDINNTLTTLNSALDNKSNKGHHHTASYKPSGSISEIKITPAGTVSSTFEGIPVEHTHTFTGTKATINADYTPTGSVTNTFVSGSGITGAHGSTQKTTVPTSGHLHEYTPSGTVSKPTFTGETVETLSTLTTSSVNSVKTAGTQTSLTASVSSRCLTLTFTPNTLMTYEEISIPTPTHTHSVTAAGSVSQPTFTGTKDSVLATGSTTNVSSIEHTHSVTVNSMNITGKFTGTKATISAEYTPVGNNSTEALTPYGSIESGFTGTEFTHNHTFTGTQATITTGEDIE